MGKLINRSSLFASFLLIRELVAQEACIADEEINDFFATDAPTCCQFDVCGIPCPEEVSAPSNGFGIAIGIGIGISFLIGIATFFLVKGEAENFFVAGRSLPLWVVALTLGAQSIDSNAILGNADLSYKFHFYDGAVLPIGLGLSLILNAIFLARHINREEGILTLPDVFGKRYGKLPELLVSIATIVSFMMLLAGNLVGMSVIISYVWDIEEEAAIWTATAVVWAYTISGGLFSVAYTDVLQGAIGWTGCMVLAFYMIKNSDPNAPPESIGFPGYIYPDGIGDGGICDEYEGVPCENDESFCCYNTDKWCPTDDNCVADNGAYPFGDKPVFSNQMTDAVALTPFPNAIFFNWATIFVLGFGNLAALDFQARCMAAKTPSIATWGCIIGGLFTFVVGIPFAYLGAITRVHYGPDSTKAEFLADSCHALLGLPTCALWLPDPLAFVKLLTHEAPKFIGGWCLFGIVAASMSTADGAILAMGTVFSHNVVRMFFPCFPSGSLLMLARLSTIPAALAAALIAVYNAGKTGYLLIVAFDVVLATVVAPLFGCFYTKNPSANAALLSVLAGGITRTILEFTLPKDGFLILPYEYDEFLNTGPAASVNYPPFFDEPSDLLWDPAAEPCDQPTFEDYTGVDSLSAFVVSVLVFVFVQTMESKCCKLFTLPFCEGYEKDTSKKDYEEEE